MRDFSFWQRRVERNNGDVEFHRRACGAGSEPRAWRGYYAERVKLWLSGGQRKHGCQLAAFNWPSGVAFWEKWYKYEHRDGRDGCQFWDGV